MPYRVLLAFFALWVGHLEAQLSTVPTHGRLGVQTDRLRTKATPPAWFLRHSFFAEDAPVEGDCSL